MELEWPEIPPTTANPYVLLAAAARLESMVEDIRAAARELGRLLHAGGSSFTPLVATPAADRALEHEGMATAVTRLLSYGATVTRGWADDVLHYQAERQRIVTSMVAFETRSTPWDPPNDVAKIGQIRAEATDLVRWFEDQARRRGGQLHDGPTPDRLSELGRAGELHGPAGQIWDSWQPPPLQVDGVAMPELVRRWQDGDVVGAEAHAAAEWYADYQEWREQLLAGGRYLNADDLDAVRSYEAELAAAGLGAAVVAGRLSARRDATEFWRIGRPRERSGGYEVQEDPLPLAERHGPDFSVEVGETTRPRFAHSDERFARYRSEDDHRRDWFVDAQAGSVFEGIDNAGLTAKTGASVEAGWRTGAMPIDGVPGSTRYTFGSVSAAGSGSISLDPDRLGAYGEAGAEATLAKVSNDRLVEADVGPLTVSGGGEVGVGAGATAKGGVYLEDGKLHFGWKAGAKVGIGGKVIVNGEVDLEELVDLLTPWDEPKAEGGQ